MHSRYKISIKKKVRIRKKNIRYKKNKKLCYNTMLKIFVE